jgi:hypothetical protein
VDSPSITCPDFRTNFESLDRDGSSS